MGMAKLPSFPACNQALTDTEVSASRVVGSTSHTLDFDFDTYMTF